MPCPHLNFAANVDVARIKKEPGGPVERFHANVTIHCTDCGVPFRFIGLPAGLDLNGAAVSVNGTEGRFTIAPEGEVMTPLEGTTGFTVKRVK